MKLLEILQKELDEFPKDMTYAVQDDDGVVKFGKHSQPTLCESGIWQRREDGNYLTIPRLELAEDWDSAIVTKDMWEGVKVKSKTLDSLQPKHKHAEMIALCAEFAQTMENPMVMFQFKDCGVWVDFDLDSNLAFYNHREYRLKPKTHIVNGVEIPDLRIETKAGDRYWSPDSSTEKLVYGTVYGYEPTIDTHRVSNNLCYEPTEEGKQAAILHARAWLGEGI